jgi:Tol biopolymer transport system component
MRWTWTLALLTAACSTTSPPAGTTTSLRLDGATPVTPTGTRYAGARFSPDGGTLAVARAGLADIDLVDLQTGAVRSLVSDTPGAGWRFAFSPDSAALIYRDRQNTLRRAWLADGRVETLVSADARLGFPAFASDGELHVSLGGALTRVPSGSAAPRSASPERQVAHDGLLTVTATAAPIAAGWDGKEIFVVDLPTGARRTLLSGRGFFDVELAADGTLALVTESRGAEGHLWIVPTNGGAPRDLGVGYHGCLTHDARTVVFLLQENDGQQFTASDLWARPVNGGPAVRLTDTPDVLEIVPTLSSDGDLLAYVDDATGRVHVARLSGGVR